MNNSSKWETTKRGSRDNVNEIHTFDDDDDLLSVESSDSITDTNAYSCTSKDDSSDSIELAEGETRVVNTVCLFIPF